MVDARPGVNTFVVQEGDDACDLEDQAGLDAVLRVEEFCGLREPPLSDKSSDRVSLRER